MPRTSLMMRFETRASSSCGSVRPVRGHEVGRLHRAQRDHVLVGAAVAHHAHRAHRQEHGERLRGQVVPGRAVRVARGAQLVDEDRVGAAQQIGVLALHLAQDAHAEARARERMAVDHLARQAELQPELAHLVLEELAQRLEQLQVQRLGQAADVVVRLDRVRLLRLRARRLDHVRIDRALREPFRAARSLRRFALEDVDEQPPDDLALLLRDRRRRRARRGTPSPASTWITRTPRLRANVSITCVGLVLAQQAVVDEHAGELVADRLVDQRCGHRRIDAARQAEDHLVAADLRADRRARPRRRSRACSSRSPQPQMSCAKRARIAAPCFVCVTSGWNCTA